MASTITNLQSQIAEKAAAIAVIRQNIANGQGAQGDVLQIATLQEQIKT